MANKTNNATDKDILTFLESVVAGTPVDTSDISIADYAHDDASCAQLRKQNLRRYELIDADGIIVPNARERFTYDDGTVVISSPFFTAAAALTHATITRFKQGSIAHAEAASEGKAKSGGFAFLPSKEDTDEQIAKAHLLFTKWLAGKPVTVTQLPALYLAYKVNATLIPLGATLYIRQVVLASSTEQPLSHPLLALETSVPDTIGGELVANNYTYKLLEAMPIVDVEEVAA